MPFYEFLCSEGHRTEEFYGINDAPMMTLCPKCRATANRTYSAPHFNLKGGGVSRTVNPK